MIFRDTKADWDRFKSYMVESSLSALFKNRASRTAISISEWNLFDIENVIPQKNTHKCRIALVQARM